MPTRPNEPSVLEPAFKVTCGEKTVGAALVQLTATSSKCRGVWFGAPTASHTVGATNDGPILIGGAGSGNQKMTLTEDDFKGFIVPISDPSLLWLLGFNAGDVVAYAILQ